jgi:tetratricopeptide (TPR) repeat protein
LTDPTEPYFPGFIFDQTESPCMLGSNWVVKNWKKGLYSDQTLVFFGIDYALISTISNFFYILKKERLKKLAPLVTRLKANSITPGDKREILEEIMEIVKINKNILTGLAYYSAMNEEWDLALKYARAFLKVEGRENAGRLNIGLLEPCILNNIGRKDEAIERLKVFSGQIKNQWYRHIARCLLGEESEQSIVERAGESPEYLITAHCALGFWAEGSGENKKALKHYKEALGSYMDDWLEYEFTMERIKKLNK